MSPRFRRRREPTPNALTQLTPQQYYRMSATSQSLVDDQTKVNIKWLKAALKHPFNISSLGFKNVSNVSRKKEVIQAFRSNLLNCDGKCDPDYSWNENVISISRKINLLKSVSIPTTLFRQLLFGVWTNKRRNGNTKGRFQIYKREVHKNT